MIVEPAPRSGTSGEQMDPSFIAVLQDSKLGRRQPSQPDSSIHVDMSPVEPAEAAEMLEMSEIGGSARNPHATAEPSEVPKPALQRGRYSLRFLLWFTVGTYVVGCMVVMGVLYLTDRFPYYLFFKHEYSPYGRGHGHSSHWLIKHHLAVHGLPPPRHPLSPLPPPPPFPPPPLPDILKEDRDPSLVWVRTGPDEGELKSFVLRDGYPFTPHPVAIETCMQFSGLGPVTATKQVYREGFFALNPSLYGAGSISFMRSSAVRQPQAHVPFAAEVLDSGMGLPDTSQNSTKTSSKPSLARFKSYNVTVTFERTKGQAQLLRELYVCPVKLPLYGGGVSVFTSENGELRPLVSHRDSGLIADLNITVTIPPDFPPSAVGFRAIAPPLPPHDKSHNPQGPRAPPLVRLVSYVTSNIRSIKTRISSLLSNHSGDTTSSHDASATPTSALSPSL